MDQVVSNTVDMSIYNTKESQASALDAEIAQAEKDHAEEFGLDVPAEKSDAVTSGEPANTPATSVEELQEQLEKSNKRYKDKQSPASKKEAELLKEIEALKARMTDGDQPVDPVDDLSKEVKELKDDKAARELAEHNQREGAAVAAVHPDYVEVITSPEFTEWLKGQPNVYNNAIYADHSDAKLAINALDLFKYQTGAYQADQSAAIAQQREAAAMSVKGGQRSAPTSQDKKMWRWDQIQKLSQSDYEKHEKEIDDAFIHNRVIY